MTPLRLAVPLVVVALGVALPVAAVQGHEPGSAVIQVGMESDEGWDDEDWEDDDWEDDWNDTWDDDPTWDPLESWNRRVFAFNEVADTYVIRPTAVVYQENVPRGARRSIRNFLRNLGEPLNAGTNYLRGRGEAGTRNVVRFFVNTTFGVFGLFDVAGAAGIEEDRSDFGLTFGTWGAPEGPYLVLPLLGPSTARDTTGLGAQYGSRRQHSPYHWADTGTGVRYTSIVVQGVDTRASLLSMDELIEQTGSDRYIFMRESYLQNRRERLGEDDWDQWDDDWDDDAWEDDEEWDDQGEDGEWD